MEDLTAVQTERRPPAPLLPGVSVAVLVPCLNEQSAVRKVVQGFQQSLPGAVVYVYDNGSDDDTVREALDAGAVVRREARPGKGNVVRRMFADVEADVYVMVDGDGTYDPSDAPTMVHMLVEEGLDMVVGRRLHREEERKEVYRPGHDAGNRLFSTLLRLGFGGTFSDVFSGYRVLSRRLVKTFPVTSTGFEIETELTAHALDLAVPVAELDTDYGAREGDSASKLRTYRDGSRILLSALRLFRVQRPGRYFGVLFLVLTLVSLVLGLPIVVEFLDTGEVPRFPTAIAAAAMQTIAFICLSAGIVLDAVGRVRRETKQLHYLAHRHVAPTQPAQLVTGRISN